MPPREIPSTSDSLLAQAKRRDSIGWERLTAIYGPIVYEWSRRAGLQPADAADVLQEVLMATYSNLNKFRIRRTGDSFRGWLRTIHRSKLMNHFRQKKEGSIGSAVKHLPAADADLANEDRAERSELVRRAMNVIQDDFEKRTWEAFSRSAIDGQRICEVARDLGMSSAAVCMSRSRVLRRLRETLGDLGELSEL